MLERIIKDLKKAVKPGKAQVLARFFKTGKGEYGEGDVFLGIMVPEQRKIVKKYYKELLLAEVQPLLNSQIHEYRLTALLILVAKYEKADGKSKTKIYKFYLKNLKRGKINNWDLVDLSAPKILGTYLLDRPKDVLYNLAASKNLWARRVAILSTLAFIRQGKFFDTLKISQSLISDQEDLLYKATGWMLREVGKKEEKVLLKFLNQFASEMPRTMLRYSLERLKPNDRIKYLTK
jgi:3-methyladenine DNA glycosylase AlkD